MSGGAAPLPFQKIGEQERGGAHIATAALQSDIRYFRRKVFKYICEILKYFTYKMLPHWYLSNPFKEKEKYH